MKRRGGASVPQKTAPAPLSRRLASIEVSPTVATAARATALRAQGREVLDFSVGEPDQETPEAIRRAAAAAMQRGETRYVPSLGVPALRKAVAERYAADLGVLFGAAEVAITLGGKQAYALACEAILDPGDEVVIPSPHWPTFAEAPRILGAKPVFARLDPEKGFGFDPDRILARLSARTRAVVINSPSNPTGAIISDAALMDVARGIRKRSGAFLIYDDTYARIQFTPLTQVLGEVRSLLGDRLLIAGTASKTYCMTGWRIGWLLASESIVRGVSALISHETQCANSFAQFGAVEALSGSQSVVEDLVTEYRARRDMVVSALRLIPGLRCHAPDGAFYAFFDVRGVLGPRVRDSLAYCGRLLDEEGVALVAGEGFGCPGFARLSFARSRNELGRGLERIRAFTQRLSSREIRTRPKAAAAARRRRAA